MTINTSGISVLI